jgi:preprotein translocase subunit SecA
MAGRGTDIVLGGSPPNAEESKGIVDAGGLHVLGSERHEARRIDNQLRGRTGRQGDPGSSRFYLALDDELMRLFGGDRLSQFMDSKFLQSMGGNWQEGEAIESGLLTRQIESAQRKVEAMNFDIRKQLLDFDNVMNKQREAIYDLRNDILDGEDVSQQVKDMTQESVAEKLDLWCSEKTHPEEWDLKSLSLWVKRTFDVSIDLNQAPAEREDLRKLLMDRIEKVYQLRESLMTKETMRDLERMILLHMIDTAWKEHLYDLDHLKKGINLRAYGQKDPKIEYQKESFAMFEEMMNRIRESAIEYLFKLQIVPAPARTPARQMQAEKPEFSLASASAQGQASGDGDPLAQGDPVFSPSRSPAAVTAVKKIGRNDPCICGSGKKHKKCCGK